MRKLLLIAAGVTSLGATAQNWVDTVPKPRKVILEEFTGIHCGYCPDGHKIANDMVAANPGKVYLINIHAGGFAIPGAGEPDLTTTEGTAIDGAAGITGYPSGSVNRASSPWGQNRSSWNTLATGILGQTSPVNVAVKASVDFATRELVAEVEVYYTSDGPGATNYLTVALTQDDILGPQSDYGNYNPTNWVNGKYRHNHVLRQHLTTGSFGEAINTTTKGSYVYKKYTLTLPADYKGVKVELSKLNIVAFVAQGNNNILSGGETAVEFDDAIKADLSVADLTPKPSLCATTIAPKVEVTNVMDNVVTAFKISAVINNTTYTKVVTGNIAKNQKVTVDWGDINLPTNGVYSVSIGGIDSVTGSTGNKLYDIQLANDGASVSGLAFRTTAVPANNIWCGFETTNNIGLDLSENDNVAIPTSTTPYGAWSSRAMRFSLHSSWGGAGKPAHILLGKVNLANINAPGMGYWYAYSDGNLGGTAPTVAVSVSKDCGATWNVVNTTTAEQTGQPADPNNFYVPATTAYKNVYVNLDAYKSDEVLVKLSVTPGSTGNAFYLDEIMFNSFAKLGIKENAEIKFEVYPNPSSGLVTLNVPAFKNSAYTVTDITGKVVKSGEVDGTESNINCGDLNNGVYFIEVTAAGKASTQKLIIAK